MLGDIIQTVMWCAWRRLYMQHVWFWLPMLQVSEIKKMAREIRLARNEN